MKDNIKILEDLVVEAVERLGTLRRERDELREQIDGLERRLEALESDRNASTDGASAWEARRAQAAAIVQDVLAELRNEASAARSG